MKIYPRPSLQSWTTTATVAATTTTTTTVAATTTTSTATTTTTTNVATKNHGFDKNWVATIQLTYPRQKYQLNSWYQND